MKKLIKCVLASIFLVSSVFITVSIYGQEEAEKVVSGLTQEEAPPVKAEKVVERHEEEAAIPSKEEKAEEVPEKIKIEIDPALIDKEIPLYKADLKALVFEAEQKIKEIDQKLKCEEGDKAAREYFDKGSAFYNEGKFAEAKKEWETALKSATTPSMRGAIKGCVKRAQQKMKEAGRGAAKAPCVKQPELDKQQRQAQMEAQRRECEAKREAQRRQLAAQKEAAKKQREIERQQRQAQREVEKRQCEGRVAQRKTEPGEGRKHRESVKSRQCVKTPLSWIQSLME